jgi:hypothetical protein
MEIRFLTSGLACWNRKVKRAERASEPAVRSSSFIVDDQLQAPATHTRRGLRLCPDLFVPNETRSVDWSHVSLKPCERLNQLFSQASGAVTA